MGVDSSVIIVGGGHNGLVAAWYLARAGLPVQVLERREIVGGASVTEEWSSGYRISTCAQICHMLQKKVVDDLELRKYGFQVYNMDPSCFLPFPKGKSLQLWQDESRTKQEIGKISAHDASAWDQWIDFWSRTARLLGEFFLTPPPTMRQLMDKAVEFGEDELLETLLVVPMKDLIKRYFESEEVRAIACHLPAGEYGDISSPGSAFANAFLRVGEFQDNKENSGIVRGGMGSITQSMARAAEARGVQIRTNAEVKRIVTKNGRVTGVELVNGELIEADIVISNADPKRTFLKLIDQKDLDEGFVTDVMGLKTAAASLKFFCAVKELPDFSAYLGSEFDAKDIARIAICPSLQYFQASWEDACNGRITRTPIIHILIPSAYDPTVAPEGHHLLSAWVAYHPPHLKGRAWAEARQETGEQIIDEISKYAPNIRDVIIDWTVFTPEDIEARTGLTDGNIRQLDMIPQQMLSRRPLANWSQYRAPVGGLYLCGAGTHPGGEVTGAPGHNAAQAILRDVGIDA